LPLRQTFAYAPVRVRSETWWPPAASRTVSHIVVSRFRSRWTCGFVRRRERPDELRRFDLPHTLGSDRRLQPTSDLEGDSRTYGDRHANQKNAGRE
jgi:hypothetical protein